MVYTKVNDTSYSYVSLTKLDTTGNDVFSRIISIMNCFAIPEYSGDLGVNTKPALVLCLQNNDTTATISRVFFVKCFVPVQGASASDSNVIVGEIANGTSAVYTAGGPQPVTLLQNVTGSPIIPPSSATLYSSTVAYSNGNIVYDATGNYYMYNNATSASGKLLTETAYFTPKDYSYSLSYSICAAGNRPQGFSYTDCCSNISNSAYLTISDYVAPSGCITPTAISASVSTPSTPTVVNNVATPDPYLVSLEQARLLQKARWASGDRGDGDRWRRSGGGRNDDRNDDEDYDESDNSKSGNGRGVSGRGISGRWGSDSNNDANTCNSNKPSTCDDTCEDDSYTLNGRTGYWQ